MANKKYLEIEERRSLDNGGYALEGSVVDVIERLKKYVYEFGEGVFLEYDTGWYDDEPEYILKWKRLETDDERDARLAAKRKERASASKRLEKAKERRRKMYEKLKKEFEK